MSAAIDQQLTLVTQDEALSLAAAMISEAGPEVVERLGGATSVVYCPVTR